MKKLVWRKSQFMWKSYDNWAPPRSKTSWFSTFIFAFKKSRKNGTFNRNKNILEPPKKIKAPTNDLVSIKQLYHIRKNWVFIKKFLFPKKINEKTLNIFECSVEKTSKGGKLPAKKFIIIVFICWNLWLWNNFWILKLDSNHFTESLKKTVLSDAVEKFKI